MWKKRKRIGAVKRKIARAIANNNDETSFIEEVNDVRTNQSQALPSTSSEGSVGKIVDKDEQNSDVECSGPNDDVSSCSSASSSSDDDDEFSKNILFRQRIKEWAIEKNISQVALNDLSTIINSRFPEILPRDARTILRTVKEIRIETIEQGEYWHNSLTDSLKKSLEKWIDVPTKVTLNFNFDGLPIFKSSNKEFWPILCSIHEKPDIQPFVIGIYFGVGKPKQIDQYLDHFVKEMEHLIQDGIYIEQVKRKISIEIRCIICDSPARAYIKGK